MNRSQERIELNQTIEVFDMINGGLFGELVNITTEGFMVMTEKPIPTHAIYQLSLSLPDGINADNSISLGADCLWCRDVENFKRHWAGLQIIDASDQAIESIARLIDQHQK